MSVPSQYNTRCAFKFHFLRSCNLTYVHVSLHSGPAFTLTMAGKHAIDISVVASCRTSVYTATLQARKPTYSWLSRVSYTTAWQAHRPPPARGSADYSGQPKRIRLILTSLCGFTPSRLIHPPLVQHKFKTTANWVVCQNCRLRVTGRGRLFGGGLRNDNLAREARCWVLARWHRPCVI